MNRRAAGSILFFLSVFASSCGPSADDDVSLAGQSPAPANHAVVVAELFTSEGCSSCPPADEFLRQIAREPWTAGIEVLGLEEHVDYWDRLGWRDPFSSAGFTSRQSSYEARRFHTGSIYTPQLIIDGRFQEIGSDRAAVRRAITTAARIPKAAVTLTVEPSGPRVARLRVAVRIAPEVTRTDKADVIVAIAEDHLVTDVERGENRGRMLAHGSVARTLTMAGTMELQDQAWTKTVSVPLAPEWKAPNLKVIGLVQERTSRYIIGGASADLARH